MAIRILKKGHKKE